MPELTPPTPLDLGQPPQLSKSQVVSEIILTPTYVRVTPPVPVVANVAGNQDPTKPWEDVEFKSMAPLAAQRPAVYQSAAPAFGFNTPFTVADLFRSNSLKGKVIDETSVDKQSNVIDIGTNRNEITFTIDKVAATFDLNVYQVDSVNGNVLIKSWTGVRRFVVGLFVGGQDGILLEGAPLVYEVKNITGGAKVSVFVEGH